MSLLWALAGCNGEAGTPSTGPRTWDGDFLVDTVRIDCDGVSEWTYDVTTLGWGEEVTVDVRGTAYGALVFDEHHTLEEVDHDEDTARFAVVLDQARYGETYEDGEVTELACGSKTFVTYGIAAWAYDGTMSCIAYGIDPEGLFPDCESWGEGH